MTLLHVRKCALQSALALEELDKPILELQALQTSKILVQAPQPVAIAIAALLECVDPGTFGLRLLRRPGSLPTEGVPETLPLLEPILGTRHAPHGSGQGLIRVRQLGLVAGEIEVDLGEPLPVALQVVLGLADLLIESHQLALAPTARLVGELDRLLGPRDLRADGVEAALHSVEGLRGTLIVGTPRLDIGLDPTLLREPRFGPCLGLGESLLAGADLLVKRLPTQRLELQIQTPLLGLELRIALGGGGLALQMLDLFVDLVAQIVEPVEVLAGLTHAVLGLASSLLVLGDPGRLLQKDPQILGTRLDDARDHPLLDDGVGARPETRAEEEILNIAPTAARPVQKIGRLTVARDLTLDRDLIEGGVGAARTAVGVVEHQLDARRTDRLAPGAAVEDDVGHRLAAQHLRRALAHDPTHGVDDVGLAAAVGTDDADQIAGKEHRRGVHEGFEAGKSDLFKTHPRTIPEGDSEEQAGRTQRRAAAPHADRRRGPITRFRRPQTDA